MNVKGMERCFGLTNLATKVSGLKAFNTGTVAFANLTARKRKATLKTTFIK
jgi:hypothetical protein